MTGLPTTLSGRFGTGRRKNVARKPGTDYWTDAIYNNDNGEIATKFQMISQPLYGAIKGLSWDDIKNKLIDEIKPKHFNAHDCDTWQYATRNQLIIDNESINEPIFKRDDFNRNKIIPVSEKICFLNRI
ncbi:MAG: hypothetical protein LBL45_05325 [Treponema sp.]|jgi:hypothetical protein|nr:hypothetical protein [Treponema sp.]